MVISLSDSWRGRVTRWVGSGPIKTRKLAEQWHKFIVLYPAEDGMAPAVPGYCLDSSPPQWTVS